MVIVNVQWLEVEQNWLRRIASGTCDGCKHLALDKPVGQHVGGADYSFVCDKHRIIIECPTDHAACVEYHAES